MYVRFLLDRRLSATRVHFDKTKELPNFDTHEKAITLVF